MRRLLRSKAFILLLLTLVIFVAIGLTSSEDSRLGWIGNTINVVISPVQKLFTTSGQKVEGSIGLFGDLKTLKKENDELRAKVDKLESEINELSVYREKIKELKDALNIKEQFKAYDWMSANIVAKDLGNWFNVFTVDLGTNDGIGENFPVITSRGLVGRVMSSGPISSKVIALIDEQSNVSARISKTRDLVLIKGDLTLKDQGLCRMDYIPPDADIAVGDTIETSGIGGIYPPGIIIGKVKEVRQANNELNRYAIITPNVDFKRLEEVFILKNKSGQPGSDGK